MCLLLNYVSQIQSYWREMVNASVSSIKGLDLFNTNPFIIDTLWFGFWVHFLGLCVHPYLYNVVSEKRPRSNYLRFERVCFVITSMARSNEIFPLNWTKQNERLLMFRLWCRWQLVFILLSLAY